MTITKMTTSKGSNKTWTLMQKNLSQDKTKSKVLWTFLIKEITEMIIKMTRISIMTTFNTKIIKVIIITIKVKAITKTKIMITNIIIIDETRR